MTDQRRPAQRGPRPVTLHDVAEAAGVHASTVSRALDPTSNRRVSEETRQRIVDVARDLGYQPDLIARGLRMGRSGSIGVIVPDLGNEFFAPITRGIARELESSSFMAMVAETRDDPGRLRQIVGHLMSRRVDAVIVLAARFGDQAFLEESSGHIAVVLAGRPLPSSFLPQVVHDEWRGGALVAEHLAALGHARVVQVRGPEDIGDFSERSAGFSATAAELGLEEVEAGPPAGRPTIVEGTALMDGLLDRGTRATAVFAHNDLLALGALVSMRRRGIRVPDDMSLVGYDDLSFSEHLTPPFTTIRYRGAEVGARAARMALEALDGEASTSEPLQPELVVRGSARRWAAAE